MAIPAFSRAIDRIVAEERLVIHAQAGDPAYTRPLDNVGRIEPAAEPDLEDAGAGRRASKGEKRERGRDLEKARLDLELASSTSVSSAASSSSSISRPAILIRSLKRTRCGLVKTWTLWPAASSPARRKAHDRAFAVGPGDVEHGRKPVLRTAEPVEQRGDALEPEPVAGGRKLGQPVELGLDMRVRRPREIGHQAAAFASGAR